MRDCLHVLTGPTASGKSDVAVALAPFLNAEVVSADSMNVYRAMDIGTAKPSLENRRAVRHHLIDVADPSETFSVARFVALARRAVADIRGRGRVPLLVGGTPLYMRALLGGLFEGPGADRDLRRELMQMAASGEDGPRRLHGRLAQVDPSSARRLHPHDVKRVVRALEVYALTGRPISALQTQWERAEGPPHGLWILARSREDLRARIADRTRLMFERGLVQEVAHLLARPGGLSRTARAAVGYAEAIGHLEQGVPLAETLERIRRRTWRVARKQMTWLRGFRDAAWVQVASEEPQKKVAKRLYKRMRSWHNHGPVVGEQPSGRSNSVPA